MLFHPFEVTIPHIAYICLGGFVVLFGMFSLFLRERLYIGEACWAFLFGVIIGPYGAGIFDPRSWGGGSEELVNNITLEFTRVVLAIGVFAIGVELPKAYMARHWKSLFFLLVPVMTWGWFVSAALIYALIPGLSFLSSLAVAACLTPTDPILAAAVVGGKWADKHVPAHIRHLLAAESGCNDGAAFPFLFISLYLILDANTGDAVRDWFLLLWLYQVMFGVLIGALIGVGFRYLMKFCQRHDLIDRHSYVAQYVSLAMLTIGVCTLLGSDDLLASFACGTAFAWDGFFNRQTEESVFSSVIDLLFNVAAFVYVGAWMPFNKFHDESLTLSVWRLIVIAILVLLLRRLPVMVALYRWIPDIKTFREAVFSGHFGPIGIGAVFISTLAAEVLQESNKQSQQIELVAQAIEPIVAFMVLCSITIHGLSIPSFSLGRRVHSVSRTWSRHALAPDWTNQARLVDRGAADIVINRDIQMEEGKLSPGDKLAAPLQRPSTTSTSTSKAHEDEGSSATQLGDSEADSREECPPDGRETVMEWQEPHQKIIERRGGPGEDVQVEVRHEEKPENLRRHSSRSGERLFLRGHKSQDVAARAVTDARKAEESVAAGASKVGETMIDEAQAMKEKAIEVKEAVASRIEGRVPERPSTGGADEEGWASDDSHEGRTGPSSVVSQEADGAADVRKRPRVVKTKTTGAKLGAFGSLRKGKLRASLRRAHSQPSSPPEGTAEEEDRGRPSASSISIDPGAAWRLRGGPTKSKYGIGEGYPRNYRIESIRALSRTRDVSPSRSVRFMDEGGSRPGSASRSSAVSQLDVDISGSVQGDEGETTPRGRVTFDIPGCATGPPEGGGDSSSGKT
ncbi:hypothetical protein AX17_006708 [Amanita inopinata Kibby_2008]|nr:hypothetical protein AX17_006708 [Amanita inopinata Kibby_2008]